MATTANARWMIYGANGYTGRLAAEEARRRGLRPVIAGRSEKAIRVLGERLGLETAVFGLDDAKALSGKLRDIAAVLHCAGPFSATSRPMLAACAAAGVHYTDITGEIEVFEYIHGRSEDLARAGIVAMPGVGFDVVPSDCLAAMLKRDLPDATHLTLAFRSEGKPSPGSLKTIVEGLPGGGRIRRDGIIVTVPAANRVEEIAFREGLSSTAVSIPWGDVSTAFYSTGIPNIEVLMGVPKATLRQIKASAQFRTLLGSGAVQGVLKKLIGAGVKGPNAAARERDGTDLWGEVRNAAGARVTRRLRTPSGYLHTVDASLTIMVRILAGEVEVGARTPSMAFGADFVLGLEGVSGERVE